MEDNIIFEEVQFSQKLYKKNVRENDFSVVEIDGIGDDKNVDN